MSRPEDLRPMSSFYPDRPALLYDELNHQSGHLTELRGATTLAV